MFSINCCQQSKNNLKEINKQKNIGTTLVVIYSSMCRNVQALTYFSVRTAIEFEPDF